MGLDIQGKLSNPIFIVWTWLYYLNLLGYYNLGLKDRDLEDLGI